MECPSCKLLMVQTDQGWKCSCGTAVVKSNNIQEAPKDHPENISGTMKILTEE